MPERSSTTARPPGRHPWSSTAISSPGTTPAPAKPSPTPSSRCCGPQPARPHEGVPLMTSSPTLTRTPAQTVQVFLDALADRDVAAALTTASPQGSVTVYPLGGRGGGAGELR